MFNANLIPAMVTPFTPEGSLDLPATANLATYLVKNGCDGLLVNGTTGESPTTSLDEKIQLIQTVKQATSGKSIPIMAGIGTNNTEKTVADAKAIAAIGVDALLVVVPYYSKPSQNGMVEHFSQVAKMVDTDIVIYNIPSRTGMLMAPETMLKLHTAYPNIIGVKQSHPDMDEVSTITNTLPQDTWTTWSGDDSLTLPMMACGASGVISVAAHLTAPTLRKMIDAFNQGELKTAREYHLKQLTLFKELFVLPNPTVVKTCLAKLGLMDLTFRSPMVLATPKEDQRIQKLLATYQNLITKPASIEAV